MLKHVVDRFKFIKIIQTHNHDLQDMCCIVQTITIFRIIVESYEGKKKILLTLLYTL